MAKNLDPLYFAFRWISVMFTQEFKFPEVLRIYDSVFSEFFSKPCLSSDELFADMFDRRKTCAIVDFLIQFSVAILTYECFN